MNPSSADHPVDQILPLPQMAGYGLQHVLVLYAGAVAVPLILGGALGLTPGQVVILINANLLTSGVATLIQTLGFWKFGARLPLVQACSFIALAPMIMIGKEYGLAHVFGAVIAGGAITALAAPVTSRLLRFFPPVVIGSLITIIGISLMPAAAIWLGGGNPDADDFGRASNLLLGLITIVITLFIYARFRGFLGNLAVLLGLVAGTAIAAAFGLADFAQVGKAAWFELSPPFAFGMPQFGLAPALIMALAMLVIMAETTGNCMAIGQIVGRPASRQTLGNAFRADGLSTMIGGVFNTLSVQRLHAEHRIDCAVWHQEPLCGGQRGRHHDSDGTVSQARRADRLGAAPRAGRLRHRHVRHDHGGRHPGAVARPFRGYAQCAGGGRLGQRGRAAHVLPRSVRPGQRPAQAGAGQRHLPGRNCSRAAQPHPQPRHRVLRAGADDSRSRALSRPFPHQAPTETMPMQTDDNVLTHPRDLQLLRAAIALSQESKQRGRHPFAALVANEHGEIVAQAGNNSMPPEGDPTQHAELAAAAMAARRLTPEELARCTLYSSAEPCCMCSGAVYWTGIGRVVYALSEHSLLALTGDHPENPTFSLPCREVFARGQRPVQVLGPLLEDEAAAPHLGFWTQD